MAESDWLTSADPVAMLKLLDGRHWVIDNRRNRAGVDSFLLRTPTDRQLRLFACACCRAVWHLLTDPRSRQAVEVAERFADGKATEEELDAARQSASDGWLDNLIDDHVAFHEAYRVCDRLSMDAALFVVDDPPPVGRTPTTQANLIRDIIGNPFRPVTIDPSWLTWRDGIIQRLAEQAYQERVERKCERCKGTGQVATYGPPRETHHCGVKMNRREDSGNIRDGHYPVWCPKCWWLCLPEHTGYKTCPDCHGTGTIATGELDPARLQMLADALEEAGCGDLPCPYCKDADFSIGDSGTPMMGGKEPYATRAKAYFNRACACKGERRVSHPLLAHLRSPGPHVRGCWAIDALRGVK